MGESTRPKHKHHQASAAYAAILVVPFLFHQTASAATPPVGAEPAPVTNSVSVPPETTSISTAPVGGEGVELTARFTQDSMNYAQGIDWQIKTSFGELVYSSTGGVADVKLQPGAYELLASYGNVSIDETLNLPEQTRIAINFVLNAGALRVLPRLKGVDGVALPTTIQIFAINGRDNGKLVATSHQPGEILRLASGHYRVQTSFEGGNIAAITDTEVKPGILRALDIDHHGGIVHLSVTNGNAATTWAIHDDNGALVTPPAGAETELALKPGHYIAEANLGTKVLRKEIRVAEGQVADIALED